MLYLHEYYLYKNRIVSHQNLLKNKRKISEELKYKAWLFRSLLYKFEHKHNSIDSNCVSVHVPIFFFPKFVFCLYFTES